MAGKSVKVALWVMLQAKPGKEQEVEQFLNSGLEVVQGEPATITWYALRLGPSTFGIFDTFPDDAGRQAHLTGRVAAALMAKLREKVGLTNRGIDLIGIHASHQRRGEHDSPVLGRQRHQDLQQTGVELTVDSPP